MITRIAAALIAVLLGFAAVDARAVQVHRVVSPGGIEAWLVEDHSVPVVSANFAFRGGGALDPTGQEGLARFTAAVLDEGAGPLDSQAFHGKLEDLAGSISFSADLDNFSGSVRTLTRNKDAVFDLLQLSLTKPNFTQADVDRIRQQIIQNLARGDDDPGTIANRVWFAASFPDHPYGRGSRGTKASINRLGPDQFREFVASRLTRDALVIGVAGDISATELAPLLDRTFGGLKATGERPLIPDAAPQNAGQTMIVKRAVPQTVVVFGQAGLARNDPDYYAGIVLNYVLGGGGFESTLTKEVRVKRGLAYGISTGLSPLKRGPILFGQTATRNAETGKTIEVIRGVWQEIAEKGLEAQQIDDAKTYLIGSFALQFDSTAAVANTLVAMQIDSLGIDYLDKRNSYIAAVTKPQVDALAKRLLVPSRLTIVTVGDPAGVVSTMTAPDGGS